MKKTAHTLKILAASAAVLVGVAAPAALARPLYTGCESNVVMFFGMGGTTRTAPNAGAGACLAGDLTGEHIETMVVPPGATSVTGRMTQGGQLGSVWNWDIQGLGGKGLGQETSKPTTTGGSVVDTPHVPLDPSAVGSIRAIFNLQNFPEDYMIYFNTADAELGVASLISN